VGWHLRGLLGGVAMKGLEIIVGFLAKQSAPQRRGSYVRMLMQHKGVTFEEIGRRAPGARLTKWLISDAVSGGRPWSPRVVLALESALAVSLRAFLTPEEAARLREFKA
jgi:hypothetical protein